MKATEFFELTGKVRAAQKLYYKTRLNGDLVAAKQLESQLDKALKEGLDVEPTVTSSEIIYTEDEYRKRLELLDAIDEVVESE